MIKPEVSQQHVGSGHSVQMLYYFSINAKRHIKKSFALQNTLIKGQKKKRENTESIQILTKEQINITHRILSLSHTVFISVPLLPNSSLTAYHSIVEY